MRNFKVQPGGIIETTAQGAEVLKTPQLNKGVAFTSEERRVKKHLWNFRHEVNPLSWTKESSLGGF